MSSWLSGLSCPEKTSYHHIRLRRPDESYREVLARFGQSQSKVILIFCGNGEDNALLTAFEQNCDDLDQSSDEDIFYDSDSFDLGPDTLIAFCSNSGNQLGPDFARANGRKFLGFSDQLCFLDGANQECDSWWRKILNGLICKVMEDEVINQQTVDLVRSLFQEAYDYFCSEEGGIVEESLGMRMCLRRNMAALCNY